MDLNTIYVGMDVHKASFSVCCYAPKTDTFSFHFRFSGDNIYRHFFRYLDDVKKAYGSETKIVCGYEAGCLGYVPFKQLTGHGHACVILAPSTMVKFDGTRRIKTDRRDAENIAKCLAFKAYQPVFVPTDEDEEVKDFIRMREDHKLQLKEIKQRINAFCLRHNLNYTKTKTRWTRTHLEWLRALKLSGVNQEILGHYLGTLDFLMDKLAQIDKRIEAFSQTDRYREKVELLSCFLGIKTLGAMSILVETGDFHRFPKGTCFASYLGLVPGEASSGDKVQRLGITRQGNKHLRTVMVEAAHCYGRSQPGYRSKALRERQAKCPPEVVTFANRANDRLRRKLYLMMTAGNKNRNVACTAIARELSCFVWGMLTGRTTLTHPGPLTDQKAPPKKPDRPVTAGRSLLPPGARTAKNLN